MNEESEEWEEVLCNFILAIVSVTGKRISVMYPTY